MMQPVRPSQGSQPAVPQHEPAPDAFRTGGQSDRRRVGSTTIGGQPASEQPGAAARSVYEEASAGASGSSRPDGPAAIVSALRDCRELFDRTAAMIPEAQRL